MKVFNLKEMEPEEKAEVFYKEDEFNARIIELSACAQIPDCEMEANVLFYVVEGKVKITVDGKEEMLSEGECLITEPATLSMKTEEGGKIMGIQISEN